MPLKLNVFLTGGGGDEVSMAPAMPPGNIGFCLVAGTGGPFAGRCYFMPVPIKNGPTFYLGLEIMDLKKKKLVLAGWVVRQPGTMAVVVIPAIPANGEGADWLYDPVTGLLSDPARTFTVKAVRCGSAGGDPVCASLAPLFPNTPFQYLGLEPYDLADCLSADHTWAFRVVG